MADHVLNETESVTDARGQSVMVGDTIVSAFSLGSTPEVRAGRVLALVRREPEYGNPEVLLQVRWFATSWGGNWLPDAPTKIRANLRRFFKADLPGL